MGVSHSSYSTAQGLDVSDREAGDTGLDVYRIEPVPEGLEHVVYPKYEEAFRLGLEAFSNPMRVNKFYRPLPHILGSIEFQKHSHAGIIPVPKPSTGSGMPTPRERSYDGHRLSIGSQGSQSGMTAAMMTTHRNPSETSHHHHRRCRRAKHETSSSNRSQDWSSLKQSVTLEFSAAHHSFADFENVQQSEHVPSDESAASEADAEAYVPSMHPDPSVPSLAGGLFDADEELSSALENYRQMNGIAPKRKRGVDETSSHRSQLTNPQSERSQASKDLENLGKAINDLQQLHFAAQKKEKPSLRADD